jgi:hypothetical protein
VDKIQQSGNHIVMDKNELPLMVILSLPHPKTVAKKTFFQAFQSFKDSLGKLKLMVLL